MKYEKQFQIEKHGLDTIVHNKISHVKNIGGKNNGKDDLGMNILDSNAI